MKLAQQVKLSQQLVMTPQLQQAIKLLQLSRIELNNLIQQELEENPVLDEGYDAQEDFLALDLDSKEHDYTEGPAALHEEDYDHASKESVEEYRAEYEFISDGFREAGSEYPEDDERNPLETCIAQRETLYDHLFWQLNLSGIEGTERAVAAEIIGNIDENGYLDLPVSSIAINQGVDDLCVERVLRKVQEFDPVGVGSRDLRECLLVQIRVNGMGGSIAEKVVLDHLGDIEQRKYNVIARTLKISVNEVIAAVKSMSTLEPFPGKSFSSPDPHYVVPDVYVYRVGDGEYVTTLNEEGQPNIHINATYADSSFAAGKAEAEDYINEKLRSAMWLIKSVQQRQRTILKVAKSIVRFQKEFLDHGIDHMRPLVLRDIAEDIEMHESTISRVTTNKYIQTPRGLFELKYFFNSGIATEDGDTVASESVKNKIRDIVSQENPMKPLSDYKIVKILSADNIRIARRTVTKYREMMRIGSSTERKRIFR